jgi:hypothetical protein
MLLWISPTPTSACSSGLWTPGRSQAWNTNIARYKTLPDITAGNPRAQLPFGKCVYVYVYVYVCVCVCVCVCCATMSVAAVYVVMLASLSPVLNLTVLQSSLNGAVPSSRQPRHESSGPDIQVPGCNLGLLLSC